MPPQKYPEPTVGVLIFNPQGELLLVRSHKWRGLYVVPGGHIELGEKAQEAARREAFEETGLEVYDLEFLLWQEFIYDPGFWRRRHFLFLDFAAKTRTTTVTLNDEAESYVWVRPEQALEMPADPYTLVAVREYLRRQA